MATSVDAHLIQSTNELSIGDTADPTGANGIVGLRNRRTGAYINDATVTLESLYDPKTQEEIEGVGVFPLSFTYLPASNGVYYVVIPHTAEVFRGQELIYLIQIVISGQRLSLFKRARVEQAS